MLPARHPRLTLPTVAEADARPIAIVPLAPRDVVPASAADKCRSVSAHSSSEPDGMRTARPCSLDTGGLSTSSASPSDQLSSTLESNDSVPTSAFSLGTGTALGSGSASADSYRLSRGQPLFPTTAAMAPATAAPATAARGHRSNRALAFVPNRNRRRSSVPSQMSTPELKAMIASLSVPSAQCLSPSRRDEMVARRSGLQQELRERQSMHKLQAMVSRTTLDPELRDQNEVLAQLGHMSLRPPLHPPSTRVDDWSAPAAQVVAPISASFPPPMCLSSAESASLYRQVWQAEQDERLLSQSEEWAPGVDTLTFDEEDD